jgi:hypothetical protein
MPANVHRTLFSEGLNNMLKHNLFWLLLAFTICACQQGITDTDDSFTMSNKIQNDLAVASQARIFFGHQSVGNNIIDGIKDIQRQADELDIKIIELGEAAEYPESFLLHSKIGKNTDPGSKCDDFKRIIDHQLAGKINYALLKFCYIDINEHSDVEAIFEHYRNTLDALKVAHPDITFIHVTAPLRHSKSGFGVWIREMLGRPNRSKLDNIKRNTFNEMILSTYSEDPIFDLAASQSTYSDGHRETFKYNGNTYFGLIGNYTNDGGHLNEEGRRHVAIDFVNSLATSITVHPAPNRQ